MFLVLSNPFSTLSPILTILSVYLVRLHQGNDSHALILSFCFHFYLIFLLLYSSYCFENCFHCDIFLVLCVYNVLVFFLLKIQAFKAIVFNNINCSMSLLSFYFWIFLVLHFWFSLALNYYFSLLELIGEYLHSNEVMVSDRSGGGRTVAASEHSSLCS